MTSERKASSVKLASRSVEFSRAVASKGEPQPQHLSLWWAWSTDGVAWESPASPRAHYWRSPNLYKIYFIRAMGDPKSSDDVTGTLLEELLPRIKKALSPP